ncbi:component of SufBCD complex [Nereida sp. MMG025]|uniref:component of SufBCD complex n=1 Tax=Nereida sp. MMG025 TaxID=2909981 RepID=UPI001F3A256A|nr:component of SufBCD complex [Nereida sp. MMG025]MCF6443282.1 component of SufBCD complex [Nereida sp. MMG025]
MDWYDSVFELIDLRSFSNLWYWIALAVVWSSASHYVLGVPYDLVLRAKRKGGQAALDLEDLVRININRLLYIGEVSGLWLFGLGFFILTSLALLGFVYYLEFAQALLLILFPMSILGLMSISTARLIRETVEDLDQLYARLLRHRFWTQVLGIVSIFVTAMWGMYQNVNLGSL